MKLVADLHIHTVASGHAFSTIEEIVKAAKKKGLKAVAITDHGPALSGGASLYHFWNLRVVPRKIEGIWVLRGVEANIVDSSGNLDVPDEILKELDIVYATFHSNCGYEGKSIEENTNTLIKAMENPYVNFLAHPGNPKFLVDAEKIVLAAKENNVLIEVNNGSFIEGTSRNGSYESELALARAALKCGVDIVINSDAHISALVGSFDYALELAREAGFSEGRVLNSSLEKVLSFLKKG